jgi:hypothetical protein
VQSELSFKTAFCSDYETLLKNSQEALEQWNERGSEITASGIVGKSAREELQRLQARFIKAYDLLQEHTHDCELCQFVSEISSRQHISFSGQTATAAIH